MEIDGLISAVQYGIPAVRKAIYAWKYGSVKEMGEVLGNLFLRYMEKHKTIFENFGGAVIQPIPLHKRRLLARGFNQAEFLADVLCRSLGYKKIDVLARTKSTVPQSELNDEERLENLNYAFQLRGSCELKGKMVILVDDVFTSGATMNECAKLLKSAGAKEVWGVTLARG